MDSSSGNNERDLLVQSNREGSAKNAGDDRVWIVWWCRLYFGSLFLETKKKKRKKRKPASHSTARFSKISSESNFCLYVKSKNLVRQAQQLTFGNGYVHCESRKEKKNYMKYKGLKHSQFYRPRLVLKFLSSSLYCFMSDSEVSLLVYVALLLFFLSS